GLNNELRSCTVKANGGAGLTVVGACDVSKSTFAKNDGAGIVFGDGGVEKTSGGSVVDCILAKNGGPGLHVREDHDGLSIEGNGVNGNDGAGIRIHSGSNRLDDNACSGNGGSAGHGILLLSGATSNCLTDNTVSSNDGEGIRVEGDDNLLVGNLAQGDDGIVSAPGAVGNQGHANKTAGGKNDF